MKPSRFFQNLREAEVHIIQWGFLSQYLTRSETNFQTALKTEHLISTESISAFVHGLKLWLSCENLTVFKVLLIKCETWETFNWVGEGWGRGAGRGLKVYKFSQCGWSLLFLNAIGGENVEKGQFDRPPTIRYRRVFYVAKRLIFNKEHLLILLCKIKSITLCKICRMSRGGEEVT